MATELLDVGVDQVGGSRGEERLRIDQALSAQAMAGTYIEHTDSPCKVSALFSTMCCTPVLSHVNKSAVVLVSQKAHDFSACNIRFGQPP